MKDLIKALIGDALNNINVKQQLPYLNTDIQVENARDKTHGDFASNVALILAKTAKLNPRDLAKIIVEELPKNEKIESVTIAGPGFINFKLNNNVLNTVIKEVLTKKENYGKSNVGENKKINIEFISANPTGPLHVGHGRGAAYGATISDLLAAIGYNVDREYYVNDAGRQMNILATSIWLRYLELHNLNFDFPVNGYKGDYVIDIARDLKEKYGDRFVRDLNHVYDNVPEDEVQDDAGNVIKGDKEIHIDALINNAKKLLADDYAIVFNTGLGSVLNDIKEDTLEFGIKFQNWFSEKSLEDSGAIQHAIKTLEEKKHLYKRGNAVWFNSSKFGDEKDRVIVRENGQTTYFASDLAYLLNKIKRGYDNIVYVFGADHHGYVPRLRAAAKAFGIDDEKIVIPLVQFAVLYRGKMKVQMSTRSGEFVTLRELRKEVGKDACRYFYVMRKVEQHMDFDLNLAKSNSKDNPVYYIQYAHARICRVLGRLKEQNLEFNEKMGCENLEKLENDFEKDLISQLNRYPEMLLRSAKQLEPHLLANYLKDLATLLHSYYDASGLKIIVEENELRNARICLIMAVKQILINGLSLLSISAPERM